MENRVKEVREKLGLTQEELAERSGISRVTIVKVESGEKFDLKVSTLLAISKALGKSVKYLFF